MTTEHGNINWHSMECSDVLKALESDYSGLSTEETLRRRIRFGKNIFTKSSGSGPIRMLWRQFNNPIGWLLIIAGLVSLAIGKFTDAIVVFAAVLINSFLGFLQEYKADKSIATLSAMVPESAIVLRDGIKLAETASSLVPGDIVTLQSGDKVPADLRILEANNLLIRESPLTGESLPVFKNTGPVPESAPLGDRTGMAYSGTMVVKGTAIAVVAAIGDNTELGQVNLLLNRTITIETPLTKQLTKVSNLITATVILVVAILLIFGIKVKGAPLGEALMVAVSLAVAAIPEGLPAVITIAMAVGVRRMAERHAVVRHLASVETLGSTTVICSDKTGTLTKNEMTVQVAWVSGHEYRFSGVGYGTEGEVEHEGTRLKEPPPGLRQLLTISILCNDATLRQEASGWVISGDPTEASIVTAAEKSGLQTDRIRSDHPRLDAIPFDSASKTMTTLNMFKPENLAILKGAPETVLQHCSVPFQEMDMIESAIETYARQGLRVIAVASANIGDQDHFLSDKINECFRFAGLIGMIDPPRTEAVASIRTCRDAGIVVKMITGDHPVTAEAIGRDLGLLQPGQRALQGCDLEKMTDNELLAALDSTNVIARVSPEHKLRIVENLQSIGHVVAMTGDGVNDAPALKRADIGVAMGISGTDVSRDAAKIILLDDNFTSIAAAVEEGRRVYDNLIKSIAFILPANLGLACTLSASMFLFPTVQVNGIDELLLAMSPSQTLWINLVASVTLSIPLAFEVLEPGAMSRMPRSPMEPVFNRFMVIRIFTIAILMAAGACSLFLWEYFRIVGTGAVTSQIHINALSKAQTICVTSIVFVQSFYLISCRSLRQNFLSQGAASNPSVYAGIAILFLLQASFIYFPPLQKLFNSKPIDPQGWLDALLIGTLVIPLIFLEKKILNR